MKNNQIKWHLRMLKLADHISNWSKDPSTKVGCVIYDKDKRIISTGYNGFPKNIIDSKERYDNKEIKYKIVRHAEANALSFAYKDLKGCTLVSTHFPCVQCASSIIQAGISTVVCFVPTEDYLSRWKEDVELSKQLFTEASIEFYEYESHHKFSNFSVEL